jgi:CheY-like chemotaxis protein
MTVKIVPVTIESSTLGLNTQHISLIIRNGDIMANPKVLVVEDDEVILSLEKRWLAKLGFDVCGSAGTGAEALDCVAKMQPDIVLMDIGLHGEMDGIEAAGQIKKNSSIPVIFVTAHTGGEILSRAKAVNPDGFVKKPFDDDDLRIAIEMGLKPLTGISPPPIWIPQRG